MTLIGGERGRLASWRERLTATRHVGVFERFGSRVQSMSAGDRVIFYTLAVLLSIASFTGVYALERSLLVTIPAYGGSITEGEVGSPRFINPLLGISNADRDLIALTYAGLTGLSGTGDVVPVLADKYSISDDGKTYTFILRNDAKFSDGTPVTAGDVVFTVKKAQDPALKSPEFANWSGVAVTEVDDHTVQFTLAKPYAPFLGLTTLGILPSHLWQSISDEEFPFSTLETSPVGAGPFKIQSVSRDDTGLIESAHLVGNSFYSLGRPYLDSINFTFFSRAEDLSGALSSGAIESAYGVSVKGALRSPYARVFGVFWNQNEKQVYARPEVRKALSLALDRKDIITNVLGGYATPIMGPVPPNGFIAQAPIASSGNPTDTASQVLKKAGWSFDESAHLWKNAALKLTLDTITLRTSNVPELKNVASAVKTAWEKLGVSTNVKLYEPGDLSQDIIRPRKYEALLYGMVIGRNQDLYAFWNSQERNDPGLNIALYVNKTVDALPEDARSNTDPKARAADLQKIEDTVAADYPAAFIYAPDFTYAVPTDLQGVALPQIVSPADRFATVASWYRETDAVWPFFTSAQ